MNAVIFAGGNQTRLAAAGITFAKQPKILYPLGSGSTILLNTLKQLDGCGLDNITVAVADKVAIADYVKKCAKELTTPVAADQFVPIPLGSYISRYQHLAPVTFIFGDIYFPDGSLQQYFAGIKQTANRQAFVGASPTPVGDFRIQTSGESVQKISKDNDGQYYTCGIFTLLDQQIMDQITMTEKVTDIFSQLATKQLGLGYVVMPEGLIDLDTPEELNKLITQL